MARLTMATILFTMAQWHVAASVLLADSGEAISPFLVRVEMTKWPLPTRNPTMGTPPQEEPDFHDTVIPRVSAEVGFADRFLARAGAAFIMSPAPEASGAQAFLDNHRLLATLGLGANLGVLHVDAFVQLHQLVPRTHAKTGGVFMPDDGPPTDVIEGRGRIVVGGLTAGLDL